MGRVILFGYKTKKEAEACLQGIRYFKEEVANEYYIVDDRKYNGQWTVNYD